MHARWEVSGRGAWCTSRSAKEGIVASAALIYNAALHDVLFCSVILHHSSMTVGPQINCHAVVDRESQTGYSHWAASVFSDRNRTRQVLPRRLKRKELPPPLFEDSSASALKV
ncbi:hypothetical protein BT69DRAFT_578772 [Atractiella rhizophila]|nr:hypothetical protein BT69DRAFT_578772 [Atractiella rhizophila]